MERATRDRARRAGRRRERVRKSAEAIRAEDRERDRLAERGGNAERVGAIERDRRDRFSEHPHERRVPRAATGGEQPPHRRPGFEAEPLADRARCERGRGRERIVVRAAVLRDEIVRAPGERGTEELAPRAFRRAAREVRLAQQLPASGLLY